LPKQTVTLGLSTHERVAYQAAFLTKKQLNNNNSWETANDV